MGQEVRVELNPVQHCQVIPPEDLCTFLVNIYVCITSECDQNSQIWLCQNSCCH